MRQIGETEPRATIGKSDRVCFRTRHAINIAIEELDRGRKRIYEKHASSIR